MKILIVGDQHFRFELPYGTALPDGRRAEWEDVKRTIHQTAENCDEIVLLGDGFNARHNHSSVIHEFVDFLKGFKKKPVHILVGNHERYGAATALDFLKRMEVKNWMIYMYPTVGAFSSGLNFFMLPYMSPGLVQAANREEGVKKLLELFPKEHTTLAFIHHAITGELVYGMLADLFNEIVIPHDILAERFDHVFAGHIHGYQEMEPNITVTGSIFSSAVEDNHKSIFIWEDGKIEKISLPVRGIYKILWGAGGWDHIPSASIVKCYVTNRENDIEEVKKYLQRFDASVLIEDYPNERQKAHFENNAALDLSIENLLKLYSEERSINYADLKSGFELIK